MIAARADGRVLVEVTGTAAYSATSRGTTSYLASFTLADGCIEATYAFPVLLRVAATGTDAAALAILNDGAARAEADGARALVGAFGAAASPYAFSADGARVVVSANGNVYAADTSTFHFRLVGPVGGDGPVLSTDGKRAAFGRRRVCQAVACLGQMDLATGAVRTLGASQIHEIYPAPNGDWFAATDNGFFDKRATRACLVRIDGKRGGEKALGCFPSKVNSATISTTSSTGRAIALHVGELLDEERVVVFDTETGRVVNEVAGSPIYLQVSEDGRVAWDRLEEDGATSVVLGEARALRVVERGVTSVGFAADGKLVVGVPRAKAFAFEDPLVTLADVPRCGHLRRAHEEDGSKPR
jgi:hypothetical protein